ncbi:MAG: hypothetical protein PHX05_08540, partial [Acidobacteriota bacterium]|nr:hypothetical protein [Acidobacteriota bacterium]
MEDEHRETLKKKIQILYQLGKWPDVVKLCLTYAENYGKEEDIEMIRFKSERHMGIPAPTSPPAPKAENAARETSAPPLDLPPEDGDVTSIPVAASAHSPEPRLLDESEPNLSPLSRSEAVNDNLFADNELVIGDPFADDEPELRMAPEEPPVVIPENIPDLEMEGPYDFGGEPQADESEADFAKVGSLTIDAEPELFSKPEPEVAPAWKEAEKAPEALFRSTSERVDAVEETADEKQAPAVSSADEEEALPRRSVFNQEPGKESPTRKKPFNLKLLLLAVVPLLVAAALWLALSGKLDLSGDEPQPVPEPAAERPASRRPRPVTPANAPAAAAAAQDAAILAAEQEKAFAAKLKQAEGLYKKGDLLNAQVALLEAKKIKVTEPLSRLEEELTRKQREADAQAAKAAESPRNELEMEAEALSKAREADSIIGWQDFLRLYPQSESVPHAQRRINALEKTAMENAQQQLLLRIQQAQKVRLRDTYLNLSQVDIAAQMRQGGRPPAQFEPHPHGGATVTLDLTSGLMWMLYNKPMAFDKAKWRANRITAGYSGWRLPTAEE